MTLPGLLQYIHRWLPAQKEKLAMAISVMINQGIIGATCLSSLSKDHLTKDGQSILASPLFYVHETHLSAMDHCSTDVAINTVTTVFRIYLTDQSMDHLASTLKKGGIKDLLVFFPANKRNATSLDAHFRAAGLPQVAEWFAKRQAAIAKETMLRELHERLEAEEPDDQVCFLYLL